MVGTTIAVKDQAIVFVVDDDDAVRDALVALLRSVRLQVESFSSGTQFLRASRADVPQCLVLDVRLPGLSGLDLQQQLLDRGEHLPIVFITAHADVPMSVRAMKAGAVEFLSKPFRDQDLLDAVLQALEHDRHERLLRAERRSVASRYAGLTAREREVLARLIEGALNKQVAADLGISEVTVKVHRRHIMEKMGAGTLAALLRMMGKLSQP